MYRVKLELWLTKHGELTTVEEDAAYWASEPDACRASIAGVPEEYQEYLVISRPND